MNFPKLKELPTSRAMVDAFKGYNHNLRIGDGEFFDMKNMTSDHYPVLSPRGKRGFSVKPASPQGLIAKDEICYVDGKDFVMGQQRIDMELSVEPEDCPKQLISMGAYVIVMPDKKYINTMDVDDRGSMEAFYESSGDVAFELCSVSGDVYADAAISPDEPAEPENLDYWIDTSATPHTLKQYSASSGLWVSIATTYVKISAEGIGKEFSQYDGVTISGIVKNGVQDLNGSLVLWDKGDDYIVVQGVPDAVVTQTAEEGAVKVERRIPNMDYMTESGNRLWGCRYGTALNGEVVNEIYASKLGDFKNWSCYMGLSTDSYTASCGTDGPFTGAITHMGYPLFFKENCVHKVYGNYPANFQIQDTACRGVQKGCHESLAIVNETLFYKARSGICAYDGSLPVEVSYALGNTAYSDAVGGAHGNKYYVSMKDASGIWHLFVYDTAKGMWHREDNLHAGAFCACRDELYCIDADARNIITMLGSGAEDTGEVDWMVETGELGISSPDMKYISRIIMRMSMGIGSKAEVFAKYDMDDSWVPVCTIFGTDLRSFSIPIRPRRCDHMRLRIVGRGMAKIYSITKTIEQGKALGRPDEQSTLDVIPHICDILSNSIFMGIERIAHTDNKGTAIYGYRLYNLYWYQNGKKKTPNCLVCTVVQDLDKAEGYVFQNIENVTVRHGLPGNNTGMPTPSNGNTYTVAQLYPTTPTPAIPKALTVLWSSSSWTAGEMCWERCWPSASGM